MALVLNRFWGIRLLLAVTGMVVFISLLAVTPMASSATAKTPRALVKAKVLTRDQAALLRSNALKVRITAKAPLRLTVKASSGGKKSFFRSKRIRFKKKGRKTVTLRLTNKGRKQMGSCGAKTVLVKATSTRRDLRSHGKTKKRLARSSKRCGNTTKFVTVPLGDHPERCDFLDPSVCLQPFANDYFTKPDPSTPTGRRLNLDPESTPSNKGHVDPEKIRPIAVTEINRADGFSPGNLIVLKIPGLDTAAAFNNSGLVPITDLKRYADPSQAVVVIDAETGERHPIWTELDANPTSTDPNAPGTIGVGGPGTRPENTGPVNLIIRPARNFEYGKRYIVALRNLKDSAGAAIGSPLGFRVYRDRLKTRQPIVEQRRNHMNSLLSTLTEKAAVDRGSLYMAWDFTVASRESISGRALQIRDEAFAALGDSNLADRKIDGESPTWSIDSAVVNPNSGILKRITGKITGIPCYLDSPGCVTGGGFQFTEDGKVKRTPGSTVDAPFRCEVPSSLVSGNSVTAAQTGTYGHGLLGTLDQVGGQNQYANETDTIWCAMNWDGFANNDLPTLMATLSDLSGFSKIADRMQQGFLNFLYLQRALVHPGGLGTDPAFRFDAGSGDQPLIDTSAGNDTRGQYMGISQGAIMGGALVALSPDADRGVLDVPGMNYSTLLQRSVDSDLYFKFPVIGVYANYPDEATRPLLLSLMQLLWDRGEANGYAGTLGTGAPLPNTPSHDVLLRTAPGDHQVANVTAEAFSRTAGAKVYAPALHADRHWEETPFTGLDQVTTFPAPSGDSWLVYYDGGPVGYANSTPNLPGVPSECPRGNPVADPCLGTAVPPNENVPPRTEWGYGADSHGYPRYALDSINHGRSFLSDGSIGLCKSGSYCYANNWDGTNP